MLKPCRMSLLSSLVTASMILVIVMVAFPAWRTFCIRRHIVEALGEASAMKLVVLEAATIHGGLSGIRARDLHYNDGASASTYVANAEIADGGLITLRTRNTGAHPDPTLLLIPVETHGEHGTEVVWTCKLAVDDYILSRPDCLSASPAAVVPAYLPMLDTDKMPSTPGPGWKTARNLYPR